MTAPATAATPAPAFTVTPELRDRLLAVFAELQRRGVVLGVGEVLDVFRALEGGFGTQDDDALKRTVRLLWCRNPSEETELEAAWEKDPSGFGKRDSDARTVVTPPKPPEPFEGQKEERGVPRTPPPPPPPPVGPPKWAPLPVRTPAPLDLEDGGPDLLADRPISRRAMAYAWRYLRRPLPDGPEDVLDVEATVAQVARQGLMLAPVYRRRLQNHAHLVLFLDQNGSMAPFHRFTRDLLETARDESTIRHVDAVYFHDLPAMPTRSGPPGIYLDPYLTAPGDWDALASGFSPETATLVVSDAGAARGGWNPDRVRQTVQFLNRLRRLTTHVAWLNPMPVDRWSDTTAEAVAHLVPMFPMDTEGLGNAVDVLRGLTRSPDASP